MKKGLKKDKNPMKDLIQVLILDYLMELSVRPPCNSLFLFTSLPILTLVSCVIFLAQLRKCSNLCVPHFTVGWIHRAPLGGPSAGTCALRGTNVSGADECLCEEDSMCVITNKPPARGGSKRGKITRRLQSRKYLEVKRQHYMC